MILKCYSNSNGIHDLLIRENYISRKPVYDFLEDKLSNVSGRFLDFGCGNMPYKSIFKAADDYIGLDVDTAKEYGFSENGVTYYDGTDIPFEADSFDCVVSAQVFEHIEDLNHSISEIRRVLKKNGILCFSVPMAYPIHYSPYDFRRFTNYGINNMLANNGFGDILVQGSNRPIDTVRFLKICSMPSFLRLPYVAYSNICFALGMKGDKRLIVRFENLIRKILKKKKKKIDLMVLPLNYLVFCKKM